MHTPIQINSPNHGARRDGLWPELVVIHYTAMENAEAALGRLCDPGPEVSAHYLIGGDGRLWQLVEEERRAWHAGAGSWLGREDVNSRSIGIELDNRGVHPFSEPQMVVLEGLLRGILRRWSLGPEAVIGHSDLAPGRKWDPGSRFDWSRLARQGLAVQARAGEAAALDPARFRDAAGRAGYDASSEALLQAFRLRHRPGAGDAPLDGWDVALAESLTRA